MSLRVIRWLIKPIILLKIPITIEEAVWKSFKTEIQSWVVIQIIVGWRARFACSSCNVIKWKTAFNNVKTSETEACYLDRNTEDTVVRTLSISIIFVCECVLPQIKALLNREYHFDYRIEGINGVNSSPKIGKKKLPSDVKNWEILALQKLVVNHHPIGTLLIELRWKISDFGMTRQIWKELCSILVYHATDHSFSLNLHFNTSEVIHKLSTLYWIATKHGGKFCAF